MAGRMIVRQAGSTTNGSRKRAEKQIFGNQEFARETLLTLIREAREISVMPRWSGRV